MYFKAMYRPTDYVDIAGRSSVRGLQSEYSGRNWRFVTATRENVAQTVCNTATVTIDHQHEIAYRFLICCRFLF